ncbi:phosphatase [Verrucomicrobiota bacterium sgz303538]
MRYAATLTALGVALVVMGVQLSLWGALLIWLGVDFVLLGIAHFRGAHGVFGKRPDGTLPVWGWLLFLPLLIYTAGVWHLIRLFSREPRINRVSDDLVVGRRLLAHEYPGQFTNYIDLTAEFEEPRSVRQADGYLAFPILDASAPSPEALREVVARLRPGRTFVHCAQGHGRTGLFAMAVMLSSGACAMWRRAWRFF